VFCCLQKRYTFVCSSIPTSLINLAIFSLFALLMLFDDPLFSAEFDDEDNDFLMMVIYGLFEEELDEED